MNITISNRLAAFVQPHNYCMRDRLIYKVQEQTITGYLIEGAAVGA